MQLSEHDRDGLIRNLENEDMGVITAWIEQDHGTITQEQDHGF